MTRPERAAPRFAYLAGFEGTHIFGSGVDVLETTEHTIRYESDLAMVAADRIRTFRACIPWHRIEQTPGVYDWTWTDRYLACARRLGLDPIVDPLHHTSFPDWLHDGFADPRFEDSYLAFLAAFAARHPWISRYTIVNEPLVTAWFCGRCAVWQPMLEGHVNFAPMIVTVARTIARAARMLAQRVERFEFVHIDSCERHHALDDASIAHADFENERRFLVLDLLTGKVAAEHPLYGYLTAHGVPADDIAWFARNAVHIDVLGLDYYSHSELAWCDGGEVRARVHDVQGFCATALEYLRRYPLPVLLSETNLRGDVADRIGWLKYMVAECETLAEEAARLGAPFVGFCWYPYIDSTDWTSLVRRADRSIDPQGIVSLDPNFERRRTALSEVYAALASGRIGSADIAPQVFSREALDSRWIDNFMPHMPWASALSPA